MNNLNDLFSLLAEEKKKKSEFEERIKSAARKDFNEVFKQLSPHSEPKEIVEEVLVETKPISTPIGEIPASQQNPAIKDLPEIDKYLKTPQVSEPNTSEYDINLINKKIKFLEQWIGKINNAGPGGGEVNLRYLDDIARETISDGLYLRYNAPTKKFVFDHGHKNAFYGAFESTQTQTCNASTATALTYNQVDYSYGVTVVDNSKVTIEHPGLYNAQFSVQLINTGNQIDSVYIWLRQNGVDVPGSTGKVDVHAVHGGTPGAMLIGWNFYINTVAANEYFQFMWFTADETHITIPNLPEQNAVTGVSPYIPGTASVVLTVSPVKL